MLDVQKPAISHDIPAWLPVAAAIGIVLLIAGSTISITVFVKVFAAALTAVMAYVAVCFSCHAVAMICNVLGGLGAVFQSRRT